MKRTAMAAAVAATAVLVAGCGSSGSSGAGSSGSASGTGDLTGTITVLAAASLQGSFTTISKQFEKAHPGTTVKLSFGGSSALASSIVSGSPADVFASASTKNMTTVTKAGDANDPTDFASNTMEIAVPPSNPGKVTKLSDLTKSSVKVALCQAEVPCGATAQKIFTKTDLTVKPVTQEADVKSVLSKVQLGEVDAGMVYVTDVKAAGSKVKGVSIPTAQNSSTAYPIATLKDSKNSAVATAFMQYVLSAKGRTALKAAGFSDPQ